MQACCDLAFQYAHDREAFGSKIGHFQVSPHLRSLKIGYFQVNGSLKIGHFQVNGSLKMGHFQVKAPSLDLLRWDSSRLFHSLDLLRWDISR